MTNDILYNVETTGATEYTISLGTSGLYRALYAVSNKYGASDTIERQFSVGCYLITYDLDGGECIDTGKDVYYGFAYGALPIPTRDGYSFDGWYTSATGGTKITADTIVSITDDQTLYAHRNCSHSEFSEVISVMPTCIADGSKICTCTVCGYQYTESLPLNPSFHTGKTEIRNYSAATCSKAGYSGDTYCSDCGTLLSAGNAVDKLRHTVVTDYAVAPTCTAQGKTEGSHCSVCGEIIVAQQVLGAKGHSPVNVPGEAVSCTENGLTSGIYCPDCETWLTPQAVIKATGHTDADSDGICDICSEEIGAGNEQPKSFFEKLSEFFRRIIEWFKALFAR